MGHNSAKIFFGLSVLQVCVLLLIVNNSPLYKTWISYPPVIFVHCLSLSKLVKTLVNFNNKKKTISKACDGLVNLFIQLESKLNYPKTRDIEKDNQ